MGGCLSSRSENAFSQQLAFEKAELQTLDETFHQLLRNDRLNQNLTSQSMIPYLKENPDFAVKLYSWMKFKSKEGVVDLQTFILESEPLMKDHFEKQPENLNEKAQESFTRFDLFTLISLNCLSFEKETLSKTEVSYLQASVVFKDLLNMIFLDKSNKNNSKMDIVIRSLINGIFGKKLIVKFFIQLDDQTALPLRIFSLKSKKILIYADELIKTYFCNKFLKNSIQFLNYKFDDSSFILNQAYLGLLALCNNMFFKTDKIQGVYSKSVNTDDFEEISSIIIDSKHPLLFIFKNSYRDNKNDPFQQQIFGAYIHIDLQKERHYMRRVQQDKISGQQEQGSLYFGDSNSFLFSLYPKFQVFRSNKSKNSQQCFAYLNNRAFELAKSDPYGLGFGGDGNGNFRIWIDEDITENVNKINNGKESDATYSSGYIIEPFIEILTVIAIMFIQ